jgi:hypothetical protein
MPDLIYCFSRCHIFLLRISSVGQKSRFPRTVMGHLTRGSSCSTSSLVAALMNVSGAQPCIILTLELKRKWDF